jgi:hypothetical protein
MAMDPIRRVDADDWRPETDAERLRRQAGEMDLTARLEWLEAVTTFAAELRSPRTPHEKRDTSTGH